MSDEDFKALFKRLVESQELAPEIADKLLQRILKILYVENPDMDDG